MADHAVIKETKARMEKALGHTRDLAARRKGSRAHAITHTQCARQHDGVRIGNGAG